MKKPTEILAPFLLADLAEETVKHNCVPLLLVAAWILSHVALGRSWRYA
jgi:hypothetical protein